MPHFIVTLLLFALLSLPQVAGAQVRHSINTQRGSGVSIDVEPAFEKLPYRGYAPMRITISNQSGRERTWRFSYSSSSYFGAQSSYQSQAVFSVPHGDARRFDVLVPLRASEHYRELSVTAVGHGISGGAGSVRLHGDFSRRSTGSYGDIAMSPSLAPRNLGGLEDSGLTAGSAFALHLAPTDWRGYTGFDSLWISDTDWSALDPAQRQAMVDWVAAGGRLFICHEPEDAAHFPGLPFRSLDSLRAHGFGTISPFSRDGSELDQPAVLAEIRKIPNLAYQLRNEYSSRTWPLLDHIGSLRINNVFFIAFLVVFAIVIGPVNVFVFAPANKRYRLFWTTPALSLGASLLAAALILLQDGTGGSGARQTAWFHFPGQNKAAFVQEQASRTSLLLNRSFDLQPGAMISMVPVRAAGSLEATSLTAHDNARGGDWFQSRNIQGHLVEGVQSTRWRIELAEAGGSGDGVAPEIVSTFPFQLERVFYRDADGKVWKGENVPSGRRYRLSAEDGHEFGIAWQGFIQESGDILTRRLVPHEETPGYFFAFLDDEPESGIGTLRSVEWRRSRTLHLGPVYRP